MRKLPRRLPSNSPSLAWVAFAVLLLALAGGMAGLYTHRQNQEGTKLRLIDELKREVAQLTHDRDAYRRSLRERKTAVPLKLALKHNKMNLQPITPEKRILIAAAPGPRPEDAVAASPDQPAAPAPTTAPSVMAVVGRP